jgi:hypothetical protein
MSKSPYRGGPPEPNPKAAQRPPKAPRAALDPAIRDALILWIVLGAVFGITAIRHDTVLPVAVAFAFLPIALFFAMFRTRWWNARRMRAANERAAALIAKAERDAPKTRIAIEPRIVVETLGEEQPLVEDEPATKQARRRDGRGIRFGP